MNAYTSLAASLEEEYNAQTIRQKCQSFDPLLFCSRLSPHFAHDGPPVADKTVKDDEDYKLFRVGIWVRLLVDTDLPKPAPRATAPVLPRA